jgi:hypothetical protein
VRAQPPPQQDPANNLMVPTVSRIDVNATTTVMCKTIVYDVDPNWAIDSLGCSKASPGCDPDASDAHAPLGLVKWVSHDATPNPPTPIPSQSGRCPTVGLGHQGSAIEVPAPAGGQPPYASWCSASFVVPPGAVQIAAQYFGEGIVYPPHEGDIFSRWIDVTWR